MDMTQHSLTPDTGGATRTELVATSSSIISLRGMEQSWGAGSVFSCPRPESNGDRSAITKQSSKGWSHGLAARLQGQAPQPSPQLNPPWAGFT